MRALVLVIGATLAASAIAQKASVVDLLQLKLGAPFPIAPLMEAEADKDSFPSYTITAPMPENSPLKAFAEYDVHIMHDTKHIFALEAKRTFDFNSSCTRALKSLIAPVSVAFRVQVTKSDNYSLFEAAAGDIEVRADCAYSIGSPYPTLNLYIRSKAEQIRHDKLMRKRIARFAR